jgi:hypothetical protein
MVDCGLCGCKSCTIEYSVYIYKLKNRPRVNLSYRTFFLNLLYEIEWKILLILRGTLIDPLRN